MMRLFKMCAWLDQSLQRWLGRPYRVLLSVGLLAEIIRRIVELPHHVSSAHNLAYTMVIMVLELGLLIHQLAEMNERFERRRDEPRRGRKRKPERSHGIDSPPD